MKQHVKADLISFSRGYLSALRKHMDQNPRVKLNSADRLGRKALRIGLETLDLARIHQEALVVLVPTNSSAQTMEKMLDRAEGFFMEVLVPIERTHASATEIKKELNHASEMLDEQYTELADMNKKLEREIEQRKAMEEALKKSKQHYNMLLGQSQEMQARLKRLSHQVLLAQEEERQKISRELHDEIAQALTAIHVNLAALKAKATVNTKDLKKRISTTERLVAKSVERVHEFAFELRPSLLDDLGLIPALSSHIKGFKDRTGIRVHFAVRDAGSVKRLDSLERTVLYRIAQEALMNVDKHSEASLVEVNIRRVRKSICMEIVDDGRSFDTKRFLFGMRKKHLGLIGMQERAEMVGGTLTIEAVPDKGTKIRTQIPLGDKRR